MRRILLLALFGLLAIGEFSGPALRAASSGALVVASVAVEGSVVSVSVASHDETEVKAVVYVQALVGGVAVQLSRAATVPPARLTRVDLEFPGRVERVIRAGAILDDGAPF